MEFELKFALVTTVIAISGIITFGLVAITS